MSAAAGGQKPVRKFPPPCWTRDEALVLIEAYRERWYALHRAFLRTPDWDAVAEKVTAACPDVSPPKTSAQCRHKMEKLRQRHRAEKQRASAFSGERFFSSWFYFEAMEAMENGSDPEPGSNHLTNPQIQPPPGPNPGRGTRFRPSPVQNLSTSATNSTRNRTKPNPNLSSRVSKRHPSIHNQDEFLVETPIREAKPHKNPSIPPRKFTKIDIDHEAMWINVPKKIRGKPEIEKNVKDLKRKTKKKKKTNGGISEMVSSIKLLGDGFMKMEKMKMDMAKEIEKMRMETEMKRNELIMESQRQILDAFVNGLMESNKPTTLAHL